MTLCDASTFKGAFACATATLVSDMPPSSPSTDSTDSPLADASVCFSLNPFDGLYGVQYSITNSTDTSNIINAKTTQRIRVMTLLFAFALVFERADDFLYPRDVPFARVRE